MTLQRLADAPVEMLTFGMANDTYGAGGALVHMPGYQPGPGGTLVYFASEDCAREEARVASLGGRVEKSKFPIGNYGFVMLARDTEGNLIGVHSMQ